MENKQRDDSNDEDSSDMLPDTIESIILEGHQKSLEFMKYVYDLAKEIKEVYEIDKTINMRSDLNDYDVFLLELKSFVKELGCPRKVLIPHNLASTIQNNTRKFLFKYLSSKLMLAKRLRTDYPEGKYEAVLDDDSPFKVPEDVSKKLNKAPPEINNNMVMPDEEMLSKDMDGPIMEELTLNKNITAQNTVASDYFKAPILQSEDTPLIKKAEEGPNVEQSNILKNKLSNISTSDVNKCTIENMPVGRTSDHYQSSLSEQKCVSQVGRNNRVEQFGNINDGCRRFNNNGRCFNYNGMQGDFRNHLNEQRQPSAYSQYQISNSTQRQGFYKSSWMPIGRNIQEDCNRQREWNCQEGWNTHESWNNRKDYSSLGYWDNKQYPNPNQINFYNNRQINQVQSSIINQAFGLPQLQEGYSGVYNNQGINSPLSYGNYHQGQYYNNLSPIQIQHNNHIAYEYGFNLGYQAQFFNHSQNYSHTEYARYDYNRHSKFKNIWTKGSSNHNYYGYNLPSFNRENNQSRGQGYERDPRQNEQAYPDSRGGHLGYR